MDKIIITVAPVGAEATRTDNPNLPLTPEEIIEAVYESWQAGASIAHLHVRDPQGKPTQDPTIFQQVIAGIKQKCDIIIQISTGGSTDMSPAERSAPLSLKPEMATLTTGTVNFGHDVFSNPYPMIIDFANTMTENGVKPEIEIFDTGMLATTLTLIKKNILTLPLHFDFVLGVPGGMAATARNLVYLAEGIPQNCTWSVAGIGRHELPLGTMAISMGGHVRVGFEDNVYYEKGVPAASNAQLVARIARLAKELGRTPATPNEARQILGLPQPS
jgi:3-keto-5-aminohexanoate cleavage enzyme